MDPQCASVESCHVPGAFNCHHMENAWREHHHRVHLAVAVKATARQPNEPCDSLAIPPKNGEKWEKMRTKIYGCQHFKMPNVM